MNVTIIFKKVNEDNSFLAIIDKSAMLSLSLTNVKLKFYSFFTYFMSKKLFVGNIDWATTDDQLKELFEQHGEIEEAIILKDKFSGRSRGFGFVTFVNDEDGDKAVEALNGHDLNGRELAVNEARPREDQ